MKLYHGTSMPFRKIDLACSLPGRDFGQGFYLTDNAGEAMKLGENRVRVRGGHPTVLTFAVDEAAIHTSGLKVKRFGSCSLAWAKFVYECRTGATHDYDLVIGPIADGPVSYVIEAFDSGIMDAAALRRYIAAKKVYTQYLFATQRAVDLLRFVG